MYCGILADRCYALCINIDLRACSQIVDLELFIGIAFLCCTFSQGFNQNDRTRLLSCCFQCVRRNFPYPYRLHSTRRQLLYLHNTIAMTSRKEVSRLTLAQYVESPIEFYWDEEETPRGSMVNMEYGRTPANLTRGSFSDMLKCSSKSYIQLVQLKTADNETDYAAAKVLLKSSDKPNLRSELKLLQEIRHNHVAAVIGSFTKPQGRYTLDTGVLIYPLASGDLDELLRDISDHNRASESLASWPPLQSTDMILPYFSCLCKTVQHLHKRQRPVKHRDIKPENILIDRFGNVILADFDISKAYDGVDEAITYGSQDGTVMYSSRDVWASGIGDDRQATERGLEWDIVSLGFVFLEMATLIFGKTLVEMRAGMKITRPSNPPKDEVVYSVALENGAIGRWLRVLETTAATSPWRLPERFARLYTSRPTYATEFLGAIEGMMRAGRNDPNSLERARIVFGDLPSCPLCHEW